MNPDDENIMCECPFSFEELVEYAEECGALVERGVILDDGTVIAAAND